MATAKDKALKKEKTHSNKYWDKKYKANDSTTWSPKRKRLYEVQKDIHENF